MVRLIATTHKECEVVDRGTEPPGLALVFPMNRFVILNKMGSIVQLSISDNSSDCRESKRCTEIVQNTVATVNPVTASMLLSFRLCIVGSKGVVGKP
jgi:hypothetical protein